MSLIDEIYFENQRELEEARKNPKKLTNFEKIKQMTVEEMAEFIKSIDEHDFSNHYCQNKKECEELVDAYCISEEMLEPYLPCVNCIKEYLESEVT